MGLLDVSLYWDSVVIGVHILLLIFFLFFSIIIDVLEELTMMVIFKRKVTKQVLIR